MSIETALEALGEVPVAFLRFVFIVQEDHESGMWDAERIYCQKCGPSTEYPCEWRRWADEAERTAPPSVLARWREQVA